MTLPFFPVLVGLILFGYGWARLAFRTLDRWTQDAIARGILVEIRNGVPVYLGHELPWWKMFEWDAMTTSSVLCSKATGRALRYHNPLQPAVLVVSPRLIRYPVVYERMMTHEFGHTRIAMRGGRFEGLRQWMYDTAEMVRTARLFYAMRRAER